MSIISEEEPGVNNKLRFGKIVRAPIVAWGFDTATADLTPVPLAAGNYGRFVKNGHDSTWQFVQALPGNYQVSYTVDPEHRKLFLDVSESEMRRRGGTFYLGTETPNDGVDWLKVARDCEYQHTFFATDERGNPMDEFCGARDGQRNAPV
jgi:hypothetical protein